MIFLRNTSLIMQLVLFTLAGFSQSRFVNPIEGSYGNEYIIVNYVDWGSGASIGDNHCLNKSYNGHQGTDFVIKNFFTMDSGINVLAVDTGVVIFTKDGEFDREKTSDTSKHLGNYIGITHSGKLQTYYGHLRTNSIKVSVGDTVFPGQVIGQIGSSGNSSDPHLHFELWYDSLYYIDPFKGPCGNNSTYWKNPIAFDSTFNVWESGILNFVPNLDTLQEGLSTLDTIRDTDSNITFWNLQYGLRTDDSLVLDWYTPTGILWFKFDLTIQQNWWYYYYWSYIKNPTDGPFGEWSVQLSRNNVVVATQSFYRLKTISDTTIQDTNIVDTMNISYNSDPANYLVKTTNKYWEVVCPNIAQQIQVLEISGKSMISIKPTGSNVSIDRSLLSVGTYILNIRNVNSIKTIRIFND